MDSFESILILDASKVSRIYLKNKLKSLGYEKTKYLESDSGPQALKISKKLCVDLIMADFNVPDMDPIKFLRSFRASPFLFETPVIVTYDFKTEDIENELLTNGATAVVSKPICSLNLKNVLIKISEAKLK